MDSKLIVTIRRSALVLGLLSVLGLATAVPGTEAYNYGMAELVSVADIQAVNSPSTGLARGGLDTFIKINRGIYNAATEGNSNFSVEFSLVYPSGGMPQTLTTTIPVGLMRLLADTPDAEGYLLPDFVEDISIHGGVIDPNAQVTVSVQLVHVSGSGNRHDVGHQDVSVHTVR